MAAHFRELLRRLRGRRPGSLAKIVAQYREHLTPRGRYLLWATAGFALVGIDTRRTQVFELFAVSFALLLVALVYALVRRPSVRVEGRIPSRLTAGRPLSLPLRVVSTDASGADNVLVTWPRRSAGPNAPRAHPSEAYVSVPPSEPGRVTFEVTPPRRGRYHLGGISAQLTDPLRAVAGRPVRTPSETVLVYPRYFTVTDLDIPLGRRYQPGGIPLSSSTGDAIEFVGTREYREGDPLRSIHWRSWARRGEPIVKEHQEEYFCRIALVLDTFLPSGPGPDELAGFEAAISVLASIADHFSHSEHVVDILAAGPDVYHVSAGRSLAYLDNVLDALACIEPSHDPPFEGVGPLLFEKLAQISTVVVVLQDWDEPRERFLARVGALGATVRGFVVRHAPPSKPIPLDGTLGDVSLLTTSEVTHALEADAAVSLRSERSGPGVVRV